MELITKTKKLAKACEEMAKHDFVAVDTEFMRDVTFWPRLCLIQLGSPDGQVALIDTLSSELDLKPFFDLMADESVVKVFHAARQDVEIVHHLGGLIPHPLFDTQVAAAVCGHGESVGYEALVREIANASIDKSHRFTDWSRRPLSEAQLTYAAADVIHLVPIYEKLQEEVDRVGRREWIREEMDILTSPETYSTDPAQAWKRLKLKVRKPRDFAVLMAIAEWREKEAQTRDVPRGRVLKDDALYEIALHPPESEAALARLRAVPKGYERSAGGRTILKTVQEIRKLPAEDLPALPRNDGPQRVSGPVSDLLKVLLKGVAAQNKVAARLVATSDDIEAIAADDEADVPALKGWRREIFGESALALKRGELSVAVDGHRLTFEPRDAPPPRPKSARRRKPRGKGKSPDDTES
ncbi:ribonuclease D [Microbaculum marinisediminis]|uniref:Ribonuclease D n=1 Tax=Microbaculum marinisediminis TaxID=2931392 RepID=A0AAW5R1N4_9HYPH|nr:ribonuclease D [Microbaculum sp. A6E488]MCT8973240.1 ribonuclease D [Microbaculum sp. A6E488]